ncbi:hypothetical protein CAP35_09255 [Chitinophagaceae bacterium IBVUCB1]|nr:hypothetical protein CAP35_09255 [Chitinophagaceae bacterium IBVUCB1]
MNISIRLATALLILIAQNAYAQPYNITGKINDATDKSPLIGVTISVAPTSDTGNKQGSITDADGTFTIEGCKAGRYILKASYIGYEPYTRLLNITGNTNIGTIALNGSNSSLKNVTITEKQKRVEQLGDTTQFNANAYKTNPDANTDDLLQKMPGVTTEQGKLKVNGEEVKQVLVDGKPFFGDDPAAAIKNLPAEVVDKIQVFDRLSEQAQFTGFDDGNAQKTINIITRNGKNNGQFGKVYAGYGTDGRYTAGGNVNLFKGSRRISLLAMSNNINEQNFSTEDLVGVIGSNSGQGRGGFQRPAGMRGGGGNRGSGMGGNNDISNFLVGQQGGITATNALGINYSDNWGKKVKISGSYFLNNTNNNNNTTLSRTYLTAQDNNLVYNETSAANNTNQNHRLNMRIEYDIDSANSIVVTPRVSLQLNDNSNKLSGANTLPSGLSFGNTNTRTTTNNIALNFGNNLLYRHKFAKRGRTVSLNINTQINNRDGDGTNYANYSLPADTTLLDQQYTLTTRGYTIGTGLNYTEPIGKNGQLQANYSPFYTMNDADKQTNNLNTINNTYTDFDTLLSNTYDNVSIRHRGGLAYRYNDKKQTINIGADAQHTTLDGTQYFPTSFSTNKAFTNFLPNAMYNYRFNTSTNLRIMYRTNTDIPSISQLQNVVDISNPLLLKTGNPNLKQSYNHRLVVRFGGVNTKTARSFFVFAVGSTTANYIGNATFIPRRDTIVNNYTVARGTQLSLPVNLNGYYEGRTFATYGMPISFIKSNLNLNAGFNYVRTPAIINNQTNYNDNYGISGGITLGSNISEQVDFTLGYTGNYNIGKNTLQTQTDNSFYTQTFTLRFNWLPWKRLVLNTSVAHTLYTGLGAGFNQNFVLWNAGIGYKFLKDRSLDVRITAFDLLNQNTAVTRNITDTYIEDSNTNVLTQYFMLNVTYTLRKFKG